MDNAEEFQLLEYGRRFHVAAAGFSVATVSIVLERIIFLLSHDLRETTVTIVEARHPRELFKYIREDEKCAVEEVSPILPHSPALIDKPARKADSQALPAITHLQAHPQARLAITLFDITAHCSLTHLPARSPRLLATTRYLLSLIPYLKTFFAIYLFFSKI
jgi:hypothetical protein